MAEHSLTAFNREYAFPHLQVFADRNQVEREETFELPAAARDRFFMEITIERPEDPDVRMDLVFNPRFHDVAALVSTVPTGILDYAQLNEVASAVQNEIHASDAIRRYVLELWNAIREPHKAGIRLEGVDIAHLVIGGASPRGMSYLVRAARVHAWLDGRDMVVPEDLRAVFPEVIAHRVFLSPVYEARRAQLMAPLCRAVLDAVAAP